MATIVAFPPPGRRSADAVTPVPVRHAALASRTARVARLLHQLDRLCRRAAQRSSKAFRDYTETYVYAAGMLAPTTSMLTGSELAARLGLAAHDLRHLLDRHLGRRRDRLARLLRSTHRELANAVIALTSELTAARAAGAAIDFDPEDFHVMLEVGFASMPELGARMAQARLCAVEFARRSV